MFRQKHCKLAKLFQYARILEVFLDPVLQQMIPLFIYFLLVGIIILTVVLEDGHLVSSNILVNLNGSRVLLVDLGMCRCRLDLVMRLLFVVILVLSVQEGSPVSFLLGKLYGCHV